MSQKVVLVAQGLLETHMCEPGDIRPCRMSFEACAVDLGVAEVVVGGRIQIARLERGAHPDVVLETVGAPVEGPELDVQAAL